MLRCVSCGNSKLSQCRIIDGYTVLRCRGCDLLITHTADHDRKKYIQEKYSHQYTRDYKTALPKLHKRFARHWSFIQRYKTSGTLLDVGCGSGHFLKYIRTTGGSWQAFGVEPNSLLRKEAVKNSGAVIKNGTLDALPFEDNFFDVVTCYDVLEHSMKLKKNMRELKRVLKPGGLLFIQAPNYRSLMAYITGKRWDWWCIPDHVLHFSYNNLRTYVKKCGFTILHSFTYEDCEDFLLNIKGIFSGNYLTKALYYMLIPIFLTLETFAWNINRGGLTVVIARK